MDLAGTIPSHGIDPARGPTGRSARRRKHRHRAARFHRTVYADRGVHFPTEQAALKTLYLVTRSLDPKVLGQARWVTRWKPTLNAFAMTFADRMPAAENL